MRTLAELKRALFPLKATAHFTIYGQASRTLDSGLSGVELADRYKSWLEEIYLRLQKPPFGRVARYKESIPVYMLNVGKILPAARGPFYDVGHLGPYLVLPNQIPLRDAEQEQALVGVVREVTRMFNGFDRHPRNPHTRPWVWFDTAFSEMVGNMARRDEPPLFPVRSPIGRCFEAADSKDYSSLFFNYLRMQVGVAKLNAIWLRGATRPEWTPIEVLGRELDFDFDYLLAAFHQQLYLKDLFRFLNSREDDEQQEVLSIQPDEMVELHERLDHCGYRWYRLHLDHDLDRLELSLQPLSTSMSLVGHVGIVKSDGQGYQSLWRFQAQQSGQHLARLTNVDRHRHVAIIVSNVGVRSVYDINTAEHDDRQFFRLTVSGAKVGVLTASQAPVLL